MILNLSGRFLHLTYKSVVARKAAIWKGNTNANAIALALGLGNGSVPAISITCSSLPCATGKERQLNRVAGVRLAHVRPYLTCLCGDNDNFL